MADDQPRNDVRQIVIHLAIGLLQQQEAIDRDEAKPVTFLNPYLQWGWDELAFLCIVNGTVAPAHLPDLTNWLHQPLETWDKIGKLYEEIGLIGVLLEDGFPTQFCHELGALYYQAINPQAEIEDTPFKHIIAYCRERNLTEQYALARAFLVRNPYLPDGIVTVMADSRWDDQVRQFLKLCYESLPAKCLHHAYGSNLIVLCPRCGWPLEWRNGEGNCYDKHTCSDAVGDLSQSDRKNQYSEDGMRTTPGIQRFVVSPEVELIQLYDELTQEQGLSCTLWPEIDNYDMRIEIRKERFYAIDMKNYDPKNVQKVATQATGFKSYPEWQRAFYVFPDYRWTRTYKNVFLQFWTKPSDTEAVSVKEFLACVKAELGDE